MRRGTRLLPALLIAAAACARAPSGPRTPLRPPAGAVHALLDADGVSRAGALFPVGGSFQWELPEGASGRLRFDWTTPEAQGARTLSVELIGAEGSGFAKTVARISRSLPEGAGAPSVWSEDVKLQGGGRGRSLRVSVAPPAALFLSDLRVVSPSDSADAIMLLFFDTTRRDAVGFGGCVDPSTPNLDAILERAWKAPRAYAPASWTIPSVAAMLTGRVPAAHEDSDGSPLGIVPGIPTMAEDFRRAGWSTAAFLANPTLTAASGFAAGFTTFFTTPLEGASITLKGSETLRRVPSWLAARRGEPLLLFVLLMDPHDPYTPPDRSRGFTPFDPDYRGSYVGDEVNRLQLHEPPAPAPADVRHLAALYHDEVRFADAAVGRFWRDLPASERDRFTLVFSSDHGEEFGEHGGWKHGPALYDDVIGVPLAIRPGRGGTLPAIPKEALVSLLDLLPTLEQLAGLPEPRRPLDGASLLDSAAWRREALPAVTMLTGGAPRAAVVRAGSKLLFFDRLSSSGIPDRVKDPRGYRLARLLPDVLPGLARFDLAADPSESKPLPLDRRLLGEDWRAIERAIAHTRRGTELRFLGDGVVDVRLEGLAPEGSFDPFAFEENDRVARMGPGTGVARLDLSDGVDGLRVDGAPAGLRLAVRSSTGCAQLRMAGSRPAELSPGRPQTVPLAAIPREIPDFEAPDSCATVFLWRAEGRPPSRTAADEEEAVKKLRALGYLH